jgi:hypothetical protein
VFLNGYRYILYCEGVLKCVLSVLLLTDNATVKEVLTIVTMIGLFPLALANGFCVCIAAEKPLWITDGEIHIELNYVVKVL